MKKRHYFLENTLTPEDNIYTIISLEQIKHFKNVLKLDTAEEIVLTNGQGYGAIFQIFEYTKEGIIVRKVETLKPVQTNAPTTLACAILKQDHFELVAQKATELGITTIVPLLSERTVKNGLKETRLQKIIQEAAEQSERLTLPTLQEVSTFKKYLDCISSKSFIYLLDPSGIPHTKIKIEDTSERVILVGPEGGWTEDELTLARQAGVTVVSLGTTILRAETAAIVGTFWITQ